MGSYAQFSVGSLPLFSTKNDIDPLLMSLFRPHDKRIDQRPSTSSPADQESEVTGNDDDVVTIVQYRSNVVLLRDRLELMGFTEARCREAFRKGIARQQAEAEADRPDLPELLKQHYQEKSQALSQLTFDAWSAGFKRIFDQAIPPPGIAGRAHDSLLEDFPIQYMLYDKSLDGHYGFPSYDSRTVVRAMCEVLPVNASVIMDLTDLMSGGYYDTQDDLIAEADYLVTADYQTTQRIIALTEGGSDKRVLEAAVRLLYPHLREYFSFMDFDELKVPGGAGSLVGFVKAFSSAGVINRVVAVFDNDAAAAAALRGLEGLQLPSNVAIVTLPELVLLRSYPTIGPTGTALADINGSAASIELFFGEDVLRRADGSLTPVQWKGFERSVNRYQGEIVDKPVLQERFEAKLSAAEQDSTLLARPEWESMRKVVDAIRSAVSSLRPLEGASD